MGFRRSALDVAPFEINGKDIGTANIGAGHLCEGNIIASTPHVRGAAVIAVRLLKSLVALAAREEGGTAESMRSAARGRR